MLLEKFAIIGGDLRFIKLMEFLENDGFDVKIYGFDKAVFEIKKSFLLDRHYSLEDRDVIITPVPVTTDGININMPFSGNQVKFEDMLKNLKDDVILLGGMIPESFKSMAKDNNIRFADYLEREEMAVMNAIPTAEGAIQIALEETPVTLHNSNCLVLGYGRIGKILSKMLFGFGANVYVAARKYSDLAYIKSTGYTPVKIEDMEDPLKNADVIFNTVPQVILNSKRLENVRKDSLIIDLASKPGGVDFNHASKIGIKTIWALSLPGKVAPQSAAGYIKDTIFNILQEMR